MLFHCPRYSYIYIVLFIDCGWLCLAMTCSLNMPCVSLLMKFYMKTFLHLYITQFRRSYCVVSVIQLRYIYYIDCNTGLVLLNIWQTYSAIFRPIFTQNGAIKCLSVQWRLNEVVTRTNINWIVVTSLLNVKTR